MSAQEPGADAYRRKTLGVLDANNLNNVSGIPQPSSAMRKGAGARMSTFALGPPRVSMAAPASRAALAQGGSFPRSSSGENLGHDDYRGSSIRTSQFDGRSSMSQQGVRRSSTYHHRPSSIGHLGTSSQGNAGRDPRPVRDKQYQIQCIRNVVEFLAEAGYPQPVTNKTLAAPSTKDFLSIFKWLYNRLDPHYEFGKKVDDEIVPCMKALRYPYADSISRSQLAAIGSPHSWPSMLAMLNWIVELVSSTEKLLNKQETSNESESQSERLFYNYLIKAYRVFLAGDDDFTEMDKDLAHEFDKRNESLMAEIENLEKTAESLQRTIEELVQSQPSLKQLQDETSILESDKEKFRQYIEHLEGKRLKLKEVNERIKEEIAQTDREAEELTAERENLQRQIDGQAISPADIDRMTAEREQLGRNLDAMVAKMEQASKATYEKETIMRQRLESLEKLVTKYNTLGYKIGIIPETGTWAQGVQYELDFANPESQKSNEILNRDVRTSIKTSLAKLRTSLGARVHREQDEALQLQELLDKVCEGLMDKREELESLEARLTSIVGQYNEIKETSATELSSTNAEIERLERELHQIKLSAQNGMLQLDQRSQALSIEYDQLLHGSNAFREDLYTEVWHVLEDIIRFKISIQKGLEDLEAAVCEDAEAVEEQQDSASVS